MTPFEEMMHRILGCQWGRAVSSSDDVAVCQRNAVRRVALHPAPGEPGFVVVQLCAHHFDVIEANSTPTENPPKEG